MPVRIFLLDCEYELTSPLDPYNFNKLAAALGKPDNPSHHTPYLYGVQQARVRDSEIAQNTAERLVENRGLSADELVIHLQRDGLLPCQPTYCASQNDHLPSAADGRAQGPPTKPYIKLITIKSLTVPIVPCEDISPISKQSSYRMTTKLASGGPLRKNSGPTGPQWDRHWDDKKLDF
ncbi:hypothetical protein DXG03_001299 [Asterophora parasitica]|uniref:Uncharacterized protein n=1 Tax=Asterophora parasitica TaxID=117018 RepID=A0A9P7G5I4_9AGAR|nr:hypothetical protein DXG03_001299 [Asterophora parasitica]